MASPSITLHWIGWESLRLLLNAGAPIKSVRVANLEMDYSECKGEQYKRGEGHADIVWPYPMELPIDEVRPLLHELLVRISVDYWEQQIESGLLHSIEAYQVSNLNHALTAYEHAHI